MQAALNYLKKRAADDWLISYDSRQFNQLVEELYLELTQLLSCGSPKILLAEREPVRFLAGFIAACAAGCPVFLANPSWVEQEWEQVFALVQPDLILGHGDWGLTVKNYHPSPQPTIFNPQWIMIPTGGSSGKIRFAIHTWETLMASVRGFQQYFNLNQVNSFCVLPLYHISGLMQFLRSFTTNGQLIFLPFKELEFRSKTDIELSEFFISLVPTQLQRILQNPASANWLAQFKTVLLGGAPAWTEILEQARYCGIRLAPTYGMTETASQIATLKPADFLKGDNGCGQVLPHVKVTICSPTGKYLGINQTGIITIQAKSLALGYYPEFFREDKLQLDDLGFFDDHGNLNIVGRSSNKIITGGENVYPSEVEAAIRATHLVDDVCVIGLPDKHWGQVVTAIYVSSNSFTTAALQAALRNKLSKFKYPKHWIAVETIPRNCQGKVNREQLQKIATASLHSSA